jgi:hypothetical protein
MERTILSIAIEGDCGQTNGKPRAARKLLCGIDEPIHSHERSRRLLAESRESARQKVADPVDARHQAQNGQKEGERLECVM